MYLEPIPAFYDTKNWECTNFLCSNRNPNSATCQYKFLNEETSVDEMWKNICIQLLNQSKASEMSNFVIPLSI